MSELKDRREERFMEDQRRIEDQAELDRWHAECDAVGVPYDPKVLVRHHRANERLTLEADRMADKILLAEAAAVLREVLPMASGKAGIRLYPPNERLGRAKALLEKLEGQ